MNLKPAELVREADPPLAGAGIGPPIKTSSEFTSERIAGNHHSRPARSLDSLIGHDDVEIRISPNADPQSLESSHVIERQLDDLANLLAVGT